MYSVDFSLTNGLGKPSISIYYSGCDIPKKCVDCHNPELWVNQPARINYDELFRILENYDDFKSTRKLRVSFLGGDPLADYNRKSTIEISKRIKEDFPHSELTIYSWRMPEEIEEEWIEFFDFGVLGQFDIGELKVGYLPGSNNQIIYNFKDKTELDPIKIG